MEIIELLSNELVTPQINHRRILLPNCVLVLPLLWTRQLKFLERHQMPLITQPTQNPPGRIPSHAVQPFADGIDLIVDNRVDVIGH